MQNDPIRLRRCRCGSTPRLLGGPSAFYFQCRNEKCGMMTPFCAGIADAAERWNCCMGPEVGEPTVEIPGPPVCDWWDCQIKDVVMNQRAWCRKKGRSCPTCQYNVRKPAHG